MAVEMAGADGRRAADTNAIRARRAARAVAIGFAQQAARDVSAASAPEGSA